MKLGKRMISLLLAFVFAAGWMVWETPDASAAVGAPQIIAKGGAYGSSTVYINFNSLVYPAVGDKNDLAALLLFGKTGEAPTAMGDNWLADVTKTDTWGHTVHVEDQIVIFYPGNGSTLIKLNLRTTLLRVQDYSLTIPEGALKDAADMPLPQYTGKVTLDTAAPKLIKTELSRDNLALTLTFSEGMTTQDGADLQNYVTRFGIAQADNTVESSRVYQALEFTTQSNAYWVGISSLRLEGDKLILVFSAPLTKKYNYLRIEENTLYDIVGNVLVADKAIKGSDDVTRKYTLAGPVDATVDYMPPEVYSEDPQSPYHSVTPAYATPDNRQLVIPFNEPLALCVPDLATLRDRIRVAQFDYLPGVIQPGLTGASAIESAVYGEVPPGKLIHTDQVKIDGSNLVITLSMPVAENKFLAVRIPTGVLTDKSGNVHDARLMTLPGMEAYTYREYWYSSLIDTVSDRVIPAYKDVVLSPDLRTITLFFSEDIRVNVPRVTDPDAIKLAALKTLLEIKRDGESVYHSLDERDRWGDELADSVTVQGNKVIIVLREQLSGKLNYLRLTAPNALCDFAQDTAPWKNNNQLEKEFTTKALDATADVSPPILLSDRQNWEVSADGKKITLLFNEPPVSNLKSLTELRNVFAVTYYDNDANRVTRDLSTFDPGSTVAIAGSTIVVTFSKKISDLLSCPRDRQYITLTLRALNGTVEAAIKDKAGNLQKNDQIAANIDVRGDITPPHIQNILISPDRKTIAVYFDEDITTARSAAALLTNIMLLRDYGGSTPALSDFNSFFATAKLTGKTLTLTVKLPLTNDRNFILIRGGTVGDLAGNFVEGDFTLGPLDANPDKTPPTLKADLPDSRQYWLSADRKTLKLYFSEGILPVITDPEGLRSAFGRSTTAETGPLFDFSAADKISFDGYTMTVSFAAPLTGAKNWFVLLGGAVRDEYGNIQEQTLTSVCVDATPDELPPAYTGVALSRDNLTVTLNFNENIAAAAADPATFRSRIQFADGATFYALERFCPGYTVAVSGRQLILTLPAPLTGKTNKIKILAGALSDTATPEPNVLKTEVTTANIAAYADETPPDFNPLTGARYRGGTLTLTFSEPILNARATLTALKASVQIARDGSLYTALSVNDTISIAGNTLTIQFSAPLSGEKTRVKLLTGSLRDAAGNTQKKDALTNALSTADQTPPTFSASTGVAINDSTKKVVTLTFSEPVISGFTAAADLKKAVSVSRNGGGWGPLEDKDSVAVSGGKMTITFATPLSGNDNFLIVQAGSLADKAFNAMTQEAYTGRIYATAPSFAPKTGLEITNNRRSVTLTFDRTVYPVTIKPDGLKSSVKVSRGGGNFAALGVNDTADVIGGKLYITFYAGLDENAKISIAAKALRDAAGNTNTAEIVTGPADFLEAAYDPATGLFLSESRRLVILSFNKTMLAATSSPKSFVQIRRLGGAFTALDSADSVTVSDGKVYIYLSAPLMGENNHILLNTGMLVDSVGIDLNRAIDSGAIDAGTYSGWADVRADGAAAQIGQLVVSRDAAGQKTASIQLSASGVKNLASSKGNGFTLTATAPDAVDGVKIGKVNLVITGDAVQALQNKNAALTLVRGGVRYVIPASALDMELVATRLGKSYTGASAVDLVFSMGDTDAKAKEKFEADAAKSGYRILAGPVDFDTTIQSGARLLTYDRFAGQVRREFPLGSTPGNLTGVLVESTGKPQHVPTKVWMQDGQTFAVTYSFTNSAYAVVSAVRGFPDVKNHWSKDYVEYMAGRFMLLGDNSGRFNPDKNMTRAEFATLLLRSVGLMKTGAGADRFPDVKKGVWYYDAVSIAKEYGLMDAYSDGTFRPDQAITREEAFVAVYKTLAMLDGGSSLTVSQARSVLSGFVDAAFVSSQGLVPVAHLYQRGVVEGSNKKLSSRSLITRAEVSALFRRFLKISGLTE